MSFWTCSGHSVTKKFFERLQKWSEIDHCRSTKKQLFRHLKHLLSKFRKTFWHFLNTRKVFRAEWENLISWFKSSNAETSIGPAVFFFSCRYFFFRHFEKSFVVLDQEAGEQTPKNTKKSMSKSRKCAASSWDFALASSFLLKMVQIYVYLLTLKVTFIVSLLSEFPLEKVYSELSNIGWKW